MDSSTFSREIQEHSTTFSQIASSDISEKIHAVYDVIQRAYDSGKKVLLAGNGGSAADAQHLATELVCRFEKNRKSLSAVALTTDSSMVTAIGNDFGFTQVFSRQIEGCGTAGDVFIGFSTSGNSENIVLALEQAKRQEMHTIVFCGEGGKLRDLADIALCVPSSRTARIQEAHIFLYHYLCLCIESQLVERRVEDVDV